MSTTGLEVFDRTLQATHIWLNEIGDQLGPDRQRCYHALRAVLRALRDRLTVEEAAHLAAEMPLLVRGIFYEGFKPAHMPRAIDSEDAFLERIDQELHDIGPLAPRDAAAAVFAVLERHVSEGEMAQVRQMLPREIRHLFGGAQSRH